MAYKTAGKVKIKQLKEKQSILQYKCQRSNCSDRLRNYFSTDFFSSINLMPRVIIFCFTSLCSACMHSMPKTIHSLNGGKSSTKYSTLALFKLLCTLTCMREHAGRIIAQHASTIPEIVLLLLVGTRREFLDIPPPVIR